GPGHRPRHPARAGPGGGCRRVRRSDASGAGRRPMLIEAKRITVDGPHGTLLAPTSVSLASSEATVIAGPPGAGHAALSLVLCGRLRPRSGSVLLDQVHDPPGLRRRVAPVDVPGVSAPDEELKLRAVVGEELAMAGLKAGRRSVEKWLDSRGALQWSGSRMENVEPDVRVRLLVDLAT